MARNFAPPTKEFSVSNTDLEATLDFSNPDDPEAVVIGDMKFKLSGKFTDGSRHGGTIPAVKVTDALSGQQLTDFRAALVVLRDYAFDQAGYTDV